MTHSLSCGREILLLVFCSMLAWFLSVMWITDGASLHGSPSTCTGMGLKVVRVTSWHWWSLSPWPPTCSVAYKTIQNTLSYLPKQGQPEHLCRECNVVNYTTHFYCLCISILFAFARFKGQYMLMNTSLHLFHFLGSIEIKHAESTSLKCPLRYTWLNGIILTWLIFAHNWMFFWIKLNTELTPELRLKPTALVFCIWHITTVLFYHARFVPLFNTIATSLWDFLM